MGRRNRTAWWRTGEELEGRQEYEKYHIRKEMDEMNGRG
jgi:hypothetical protein